jgi:protoporphyrinogen oxidase
MPNEIVNHPVVIVGSGVAGLQVAVKLQEQGVPYLLLEKTAQIGGRNQSENYQGYILDHGFQVLQTSYTNVQRSLNLPDLELFYFDSGANIFSNGKFKAFLNPLKSPFEFFDAYFSGLFTIMDVLKLLKIWVQIQGNISPLNTNSQTTFSYLQKMNFSEKFYDGFIQPFFAGVFLDPHLEQPASLFRYFMKQFLEGMAALPKKGMGEISQQLYRQLLPENVVTNAEIVDLRENSVLLKSGKEVYFSKLILACDAKSASKLLDVEWDDLSFNTCQTFYFSSDEFPNTTPLLHLIPKGLSPILHFSCLTHINPHCSPKGKKLISVTSLNPEVSDAEITKELVRFTGNLSGLTFLKSFYIPLALPKVGRFEALKNAAKSRCILLIGDYVGFPSLQSALEIGEV